MADSTEINRQVVDLQFLGKTLTAASIPYHFTHQSEEYALPFLSVQIGVPEAPDTAYLQLMYIPTAALLEETNLLQLFAYLPPVETPLETISQGLIDLLNTRTAIGYFGRDDTGQLFYRYVYAIPRFEVPNEKSFLEVIDLYSGTMATFGTQLLQLQKGKTDEASVRQYV